MENYDEMDELSVNEPTTDKFSEAFGKYNMKVDAAWVKSVVEKAKKEASGIRDKETLKKILSCIDLTTLKPTDNEDTVLAFVEKVNKMEDDYPDLLRLHQSAHGRCTHRPLAAHLRLKVSKRAV